MQAYKNMVLKKLISAATTAADKTIAAATTTTGVVADAAATTTEVTVGAVTDVVTTTTSVVTGVLEQSAEAVVGGIWDMAETIWLAKAHQKILEEFSKNMDGNFLGIKEKLSLSDNDFSQVMVIFQDVLETVKSEWIVDAEWNFSLKEWTDKLKQELKTAVWEKLESSWMLSQIEDKIADMIVHYMVELIVFALIGHVLEMYGVPPELIDLISLLIDLIELEETLRDLTPFLSALSFLSPSK